MNTEPVRIDLDAFYRSCVDLEDSYRNYVCKVPMDYRVSGRHPVISIVKDWWMQKFPDKNSSDSDARFVARMEQLLDAEMKVGSAAFIRFEKLPSGDYAGALAECARTVLQNTSAEYYLPSEFVNNPERAMLVSDCIVLIVKLADTGFVVEEVVWVEQGVSIPVAIAMELIKYWAYCVIDSAAYNNKPSKMQRALLAFRRKLFERVGLPYDCKIARVWLAIIATRSVRKAAEEAGFKLAADFDYFHMTIRDGSITVFNGEEDPVVIWEG